MAPTKPQTSSAPRRSGRLAIAAAASPPAAAAPPAAAPGAVHPVPAEGKHRVTKPKPTKYSCSSCSRDLVASNFFKKKATKDCTHDVNICKPCMKSWITMQLESTTIDKLSCPECPAIMQNANVKAFATKETYAKFDELERRAFQEKTPGWRWCLAPGCKAGQVHAPLLEGGEQKHEVEIEKKTEVKKGKAKAKKGKASKKNSAADDDKTNIFTCNTCGSKACIPCDIPHHPGETCTEFQARRARQQGAEEAASLAQIQTSCKPCPQCGKNIEKLGGCDQVACTQCGESFCWLCRTPYRVINKQGHAQRCTYAIAGRFDPHAAMNAPGNFAQWLQ